MIVTLEMDHRQRPLTEGLSALSREALAAVEAAVSAELSKRRARDESIARAPDDAISQEIRELESGWTRDEEDQEQRAANAQRELLEKRREALRSGTWVPRHRCPQCLRAILTMRPELVCDEAKQSGDQWWRRA